MRIVPLARHTALAQRVRQPVAQCPRCPCRCGRCRSVTAAWARPRRAASASAPGCGASSAAVAAGRWRVERSACERGRGPSLPRPLQRPLRRCRRCVRRSSAARLAAACASIHVLRVEAGQGSPRAVVRTAFAGPARCRTATLGGGVMVACVPAANAAGTWSRCDQCFGRGQARQPRRATLASVHSVTPELAAAECQPSQPQASCHGERAVPPKAATHRVLSASSSVSVTVPGVTTRTTLRSTGSLRRGHVADLLADRHRFAQLDELGQVAFQRECTGTPAITTGSPALHAARRERDVEQPVRACARRRRRAS